MGHWGVPQSLAKLFSNRAAAIDAAANNLIQQYVDKHGRRPNRAVLHRIRNLASLATRPPKQSRSLAELTDLWRRKASAHLGQDATVWASRIARGPAPRYFGAIVVESWPPARCPGQGRRGSRRGRGHVEVEAAQRRGRGRSVI